MDKITYTAQHLPTGEPHWVQCSGYRCLAVLNENGRWMTYATGKELPDVIRVCVVELEPELTCRQGFYQPSGMLAGPPLET